MKNNRNKAFWQERNISLAGHVALWLLMLWLSIVLLSWLIAALMPQADVRSLLSSGGVRWLFSTFAGNFITPFFSYLVLLILAYGALRMSGVLGAMGRVLGGKAALSSYERRGLIAAGVVLLFSFAFVFALVAIPHAPLLSVRGDLFPGPFSRGLVPVVMFVALFVSLIYMIISEQEVTLSVAYRRLCRSMMPFLPWLPVYILLSEIVASLRYVFVL